MRTMLCAFMGTCALWGQNTDLSMWSGWLSHDSLVRDGNTTCETRSAQQYVAAQQFAAGPARTRFSFEAPIFIANGKYASASRPLLGEKANTVFVTPGVRVQFDLAPRFAVYGTAGIGFVTTNERVRITRPNQTISADGTRSGLAGNVGAGTSFRLTRLLSFRFEVRNYLTRKGSTLHRRHNLTTMFGLAFHF